MSFVDYDLDLGEIGGPITWDGSDVADSILQRVGLLDVSIRIILVDEQEVQDLWPRIGIGRRYSECGMRRSCIVATHDCICEASLPWFKIED